MKKKLHEVSALKSPFFELSSKSVNGRRNIRFVAHEIFENGNYNENGITWIEEYTRDNIDSAINMSITAELIDREYPINHGYTGVSDKGLPQFENAYILGHTHNACIEQLEVNGRVINALVCEGTLDEMRFPKFISWLEEQIEDGNVVNGSIEIAAKTKGSPIIYDGGYVKEGRKPKIFDYTGFSIITVRPADSSAILMELNSSIQQTNNDFNSIHKKIAELNNKSNNNNSHKEENYIMDEKVLMSKLEGIESKLGELNKSAEYSEIVTELNSENEELKKKLEALDAMIDKLTGERDSLKTDMEKCTKEIETLKTEKVESERNHLIAELNSALATFSDEQKAVAKTQIEAFTATPVQSEINNIVGIIKCAMADKMIAEAKSISEQNSINGFGGFNHSINTIFGAMDEPTTNTDSSSGSLY